MNPILAAYNPRTADREPVEFGAAAARITGAQLVVVAICASGDKEGLDEASLRQLRMDLQRRGITADVQLRDASTVGGGLTEALEQLDPQMVVLGATHRGASAQRCWARRSSVRSTSRPAPSPSSRRATRRAGRHARDRRGLRADA